jgi:hypothetical protein
MDGEAFFAGPSAKASHLRFSMRKDKYAFPGIDVLRFSLELRRIGACGTAQRDLYRIQGSVHKTFLMHGILDFGLAAILTWSGIGIGGPQQIFMELLGLSVVGLLFTLLCAHLQSATRPIVAQAPVKDRQVS